MRILQVSTLEPGQTFPLPLFHLSGRKLLSAQTQVTPAHLDALKRTGVQQVYLAESVRPVLEFAKTSPAMIAVHDLQLGASAEADLLTPDGVVIVQRGEQLEEHHISALRDSDIQYLILRPQADTEALRLTLQDLARVVLARTETQIKRGEYLRAPESREPLRAVIPQPASQEILDRHAIQLLRRRLSSRLQPVYGQLETGKSPSLQVLEGITTDLLDVLKSEPRQFTQLALMTQPREDYLPDHAISVAVLSMATAVQLGLSVEHVKEVTLAALLFDVGMLVVAKRIRVSTAALNEGDRQRVHQHPLLSLTMMEQLPGLSPIPRITGYQHHERLNGSGYPHGAAAETISDFARIVATADIYAATINPRAYKSSKLPYTAMEELVHLAHRGLLDVRIIKAFLAVVGLFPVGSYLLLSNQRAAQVVGANPARIDRPLVCPLEPNGTPGQTLVDLSDKKFEQLKIVRAIPTPTPTLIARAHAVPAG